MLLVFAAAVNSHVCALTRRIERYIIAGSNFKGPAVAQMHDEWLAGMLQL